MKRTIALTLCVLWAYASFALTETIDGVTWNYYIENDYAVLGREIGGCAHTGILPETLELPTVLGGVLVRAIAAGAIQIGADVNKIIIPETYTNMASVSICSESGSNHHLLAEERFFRYTIGSYREIFFKGNRPSVNLPSTIEAYGQKFTYAYSSGAGACKTRIVEGTEGWPKVGIYGYYGSLLPWNGSEYGCCEYCAAKVEIKPDNRLFDVTTFVSMSCTNKTAKIYYTLDGSDPTTNQTTNCFLYEGPFAISHRTQVKALAYVAEYPYQVVYLNEYALGQTVVPLISAEENVFNWSGNMVTLSCATDDSDIRYTLDGSEPTEQSTLYVGPFAIDDTTTVKAKAFKTDWFDSETATATFTREWYTVEQPVIEPNETVFGNVSQEVSISCETDGATILYTTDGSDPAVNGREYKHPFNIYQSCTVRAIARKYDWKDSPEATATFTRSDSLSEAANLYGYTMETDATYPWTVVTDVSRDGVSSVRSGEIGNGGTTYLQTSVRKAGTVSFWWKAMCEEAEVEDGETYYYDFGSFSVDGEVKARIAGHDTGWQYVSVDVPSGGKHTLRWEYTKDGSTSYAPDCVWLDQVQWTPSDGSGFTMTTPEPVPYSWLSNYGFGGLEADFETAANSLNGKLDGAGKQLSVWQDYVAGTDPTNVASRLKARIEMRGNEPFVSWEPDLNENGTKAERLYKVYGSETLEGGGDWQYPTNSLHRFFKVTVEMP